MGIYPQPNDWECGPFALKYALMLLGILGDEREIARVAGTDQTGTDEVELDRAAQQYGCRLQLVRREDPEEIRAELSRLLRDRIPVLLCVHGWDHWVTAAGVEAKEFVLLDGRDPSVLTVVPWPRLRQMLVYQERGPGSRKRSLYDLHPVVPLVPTPTRARLSPASVRHLREPMNRSLALAWDRYLEDLLTICQVSNAQWALTLALSEILQRREAEILQRANARLGTIDPAARRRILENVRFVADTYAFQVAVGEEQRAIDRVSAIVVRRASAALV